MADCSNVNVFFKELQRLCNSYTDMSACLGCPCDEFCSAMSNYGPDGKEWITAAEMAVQKLQRWSDEHQRKIDWRKVPMNTPVVVRDSTIDEPMKRMFALFLPNAADRKFACFSYGNTSENAEGFAVWRFCELADCVDPTPYYED